MLRALVVLLLLANGAFFAWTRGWLAPGFPPPQHGERNPERLAEQVRPELIGVLTPGAASAALSAARAASMAAGEGEQCVMVGPFSGAFAAELVAAESLLAQANVESFEWTRAEQARAASYGIVVGPLGSVEAQRTRAEELRRLNIVGEPIAQPSEINPGLLLARYDSTAAAEAAMPGWVERGVRGARVATLSAASTQTWLRFERSKPALREQLRLFKLPPGVGLAACR